MRALDTLAGVHARLLQLERWAPGARELEAEARALRQAAQRDAAERFGLRGIVASLQRNGSYSIEASMQECLEELPSLAAQARVTRLCLEVDEEVAVDPHAEAFLQLDALRQIEVLRLYETELRPASAQRLLAAPIWESLRRLELGIDACEPEHLEAFAQVSVPSSLSELCCEGFDSGMGDAGLRALAGASWLPQLVRLELVGQQLRDAGVQEFAAQATSLPRLRHLDLASAGYADNQIFDGGLRALADCDWFPQLETLGLSGLAVGGAVPRALARATGLRTLGASNTGLTAEAIQFVSAMPAWRSLQSAVLSSNPLGDDGAEFLAAAAAATLPGVLTLRACEIGEAGLRALGDAPAVQALDLRFNPIPASAWEQALAEQRLPRAQALAASAQGWNEELIDAITRHYPRVDLMRPASADGP